MAIQIQIRRDTAANWTSADPTMAQGEMGLETDTLKFKFGDGSTAWSGLSYPAGGSGATQLSELSDVNTSTPTSRFCLVADGVDFESRALTEADISDLGTYLTVEVNDLTSAVTWANIPDANVPESAVTQHEAALSITESQISDLQGYMVDLINDVTPQLGANLDVNGFDIVTPTSASGSADTLTVLTGSCSDAAGTYHGGTLQLFAGAGSAGNDGGSVHILGGHATNAGGAGGYTKLQAGTGSSGSDGGDVWVYGGATAIGAGDAGQVNIIGGQSASTGAGGDVYIRGGKTTSGYQSGSVLIAAGGTSGTAGKVELHAPHGQTGNGSIDIWRDTDTGHTTGYKLTLGVQTGLSGNVNFALPTSNGTANYVLETDGSGNTSWVAASGGATQLSDLSDVNTSTATDKFALMADGVDFESRALVEADISDLQTYSVSTHVHEGTTIDSTAVTDGYVLTADGAGNSAWEAAAGGASQLSDLSDVNTSTPTDKFALMADGVDFESRALVEADISDLGTYLTDITGEDLGDLADVVLTGGSPTLSIDDVLKYDGSDWVNDSLIIADLGDLADVVITAVANNEVMAYDTGGNWINQTAAEAGLATDSHTHEGTEILSTAATDGYVLTADGAGASAWEAAAAGNSDNWMHCDNDTDFATAPSGSGSNSIAIGNAATNSTGSNGIAIGTSAKGYGSGVGIGNAAEATASTAIGIGNAAVATGSASIVVGDTSSCTLANGIAIGAGIANTGERAISIGLNTDSAYYGAISLGSGAGGAAINATAIGVSVTNTVANSTRIGDGATNVLHLKDTGTLTLEGAKAQFVQPNYATGSLPTGVEGGTVYDSTTSTIKFFDGATWANIDTDTGMTDVVDDTTPTLGGQLDGDGNSIINAPLALNDQTATTYGIVATDSGKHITMTNAAASTITIPANASIAMDIGSSILISQLGAGQVTVAITTDTLNVNADFTLKLAGQYSQVMITKVTSTSWLACGDLELA